MTKIEIQKMASGGIQVEIQDGNSVKNLTLTPGELAELAPRLAVLGDDAKLKISQQEVEQNEQIPDADDIPDTGDVDDNDLIPD
jgi:hypothetical protein